MAINTCSFPGNDPASKQPVPWSRGSAGCQCCSPWSKRDTHCQVTGRGPGGGGCPSCTSRHPPEPLCRACGSPAALCLGGGLCLAGLLRSPGEGSASGDPALEPHTLGCTGGNRGTVAEGHGAARGACGSPCPRGRHPSQCLQRGVPRAPSCRLCWWRGRRVWGHVLGRIQKTVTKPVLGRGRRGPCTPSVPSAWDVEGPGAGGGSACQPAEADAFHLRVTGSCQGIAGNVRDCCRVTVRSGRWSMMDLSLQIQVVFKYSAESEVTAHGSRQNSCASR